MQHTSDHIYIVCHYNELALKGGNRRFFETKLIDNILHALEAFHPHATRLTGRFLLAIDRDADRDAVTEALRHVFGIASFSYATVVSEATIDTIVETAVSLVDDHSFSTFAVRARRADKQFPHDSTEINRVVGAAIDVAHPDASVNLDHPDMTCTVELVGTTAFIYTETRAGIGGLPLGTSGKAVVLLSGGIDSPVAAYRIARRGVTPIFAHFHSYPMTSRASIEKVKNLVQNLRPYIPDARPYLVPLTDIQKTIIANTPDQYRIILYRRFMIRLAEKIAYKHKARALVTGESVGQVASQTLANIAAIDNAATMPILRPLIDMDKQEIIDEAQRIGTFATSIEPHEDTCSLFMPEHPATHARIADVIEAEKSLDIEALISETLKKSETVK